MAVAHITYAVHIGVSLELNAAERDNTEANKAAHAQWQPYTTADIEAAKASTYDSPSGLSNTFTNFVTQTYARSSLLTDAPLWLLSTHSSPTQLMLHEVSAKLPSQASVYSLPLEQVCHQKHKCFPVLLPNTKLANWHFQICM